MRILLISLILNLCACAALPGVSDVITGTANEQVTSGPLYKFRAELLLVLNGVSYDGMGTIPMTPTQMSIQVYSKFGLDRIQFTTCARQDVFRDVDRGWFGGVGKTMTYTFTPNAQELAGLCPMYIEAFNKSGLAAWGFIGFKSDEMLPAHMSCNGREVSSEGFSVCQTLAGLKQRITFDQSIIDFEAEPICGLTKIDERTFGLKPGSGICRATFYDTRWHSMILFGYDKVLVQGE